MRVRDQRREQAIDHMADHVLATGLAGVRLRSLAAAAGTSDRMLLYYFKDKDELLAAALERVATRLAGLLDLAFPAGTRLPAAKLLQAVWAGVGAPAMQPYMRVWLELAAGSARDEEPHRAIGGRIADLFHAWIVARLDAPSEIRAQAAALLFAKIEGLALLDALGRRDLVDLALAEA